jgi:hypothetical protein
VQLLKEKVRSTEAATEVTSEVSTFISSKETTNQPTTIGELPFMSAIKIIKKIVKSPQMQYFGNICCTITSFHSNKCSSYISF